ncbi:hypothetical protein M9Y10_027327 [Tritrichomonas musculus]|uniref:Uncharacterized protein n=1 Tax=Tritrichomonas musculus TaxID=1915356 RepID=A0ABR2H6B6_9EUKA
MSAFEASCHEFYTIISFLDAKILLINVPLPNPRVMNKEWFKKTIGLSLIESCSIVLISDPRSFYFTEFLFQIPTFTGVVLCTHAVYRLGRLFIKEIKRILENNTEVPINLSIIPMIFNQPYSYGEICITPYPNGTGLGNCNWLITKGNDPELVSFRAFVVTGLCVNPPAFSPPTMPPLLDIVCFLPSSKSNQDQEESLKDISSFIESRIKEKMKVIIPTFTDDSLYIIMYYLRYKKSFTYDFYVYSYFFKKLMEIIHTISDSDLSTINSVSEIPNPSQNIPKMSINFAPYPTMDFGQIRKICLYCNDSLTCICQIFKEDEGNFTMNSSWQKQLQFFETNKNSHLKFYVLEQQQNISSSSHEQQQKTFSNSDQQGQQHDIEFTSYFSFSLNDDLYRWIDIRELKKYEQKIGMLTCIGGEIKGERVELQDIHHQTILNTSTIDKFAEKLKERGAEDFKRIENSIKCRFPFIEGDNKVTIDFDGEDITITTGSARIENVILEMIQTESNESVV